MKINFDVKGRTQPDPFIFRDGDMLYIYATGVEGVSAYSAKSLDDVWKYEGIVCNVDGPHDYWAPSVIKIDDIYYMYTSSGNPATEQHLFVVSSKSPLGPFENKKVLFDRFAIDSHVVKTDAGLFLLYAEDNKEPQKIGTRVYVDKLIDPYTPAGVRKELIVPDFDEELFMRNRFGDGRDWYTIEGPFWFEKDGYQYIMYSGGCYENDSYHLGYAVAKSDEKDLTKVDFVKHTNAGTFEPLMIKNDVEEGTGHNSVIEIDGEFYIIYHARDVKHNIPDEYIEERTARYCKMTVKDGELKAHY